jgi:hypothetical protein
METTAGVCRDQCVGGMQRYGVWYVPGIRQAAVYED